MEIINANASMLSNLEVMTLLKELPPEPKRINIKSQLATISYETIKYLEASACSQHTPEMMGKYMAAISTFKLTKAETLMLLNNPPTTALEIQLMVEESEERFTDEQVDKLLKVVEETIGTEKT